MQVAKYSVAQLGARRHYAVPRLLAERGMLCRLFTDLSAANWPFSALRSVPRFATPGFLRRLVDRTPKGVPNTDIVSFPRFGLRYAKRPAVVSRSRHWVEGGRRFCELVLKHGLGDVTGIYTFTGAGLELLETARQANIAGVHDQIMASRRTEHLLIERQREKFPQWSNAPEWEEGFDDYCHREAAEWKAASLIVCGSTFVRDSIVGEGADPTRCVVLPYGANPAFTTHTKGEPDSRGPLRVLTVGEVGLRKGSPYVFLAAKAMSRQIQVRVIGNVSCPASVAAGAPANLELMGVVARSEMPKHYGWADVFLLPSVCEGSAGSIFEALASGLPVICTPNSGSVVEDGVSGLIIPAEEENAAISALNKLSSNRDLLRQMSQEATAAAKKWSLQSYGDRLAETLTAHALTLSGERPSAR